MNNLKKNIFYNIGYQILSLIVPLITAPYISRVLGKDGMGLYGYTFSIAHYFVLICMLGILNYGNREISMVSGDKRERSEKFWQIYANQLFFGILALVVYYAFVYFYVSSDGLIYYLQSLYIISGILDISWFYFGIERFKTTTGISAINKILTTALIFLLVKRPEHVWVYTIIVAGGTLMNNVCYWALLKKHVVISKVQTKDVLQHLKPLLLLFIPVIAVNVYKYIDKIMLGAMLNVGEVGIFEAAEKLTNIPMGFIAAIGTVMLPRISNMLSSNEREGIARYNNMSLNLVMFLSFGMTFGLAGIADVFIPLFYGDAFASATPVLIWLSPCMLFVSWANVIRTQYLLPNRKDVVFCVSVISGALVNVVSNLVLIPRFGAIGAAISTLIAEVMVCLVQSVVANKDMHLLRPLATSLPYLAIGSIMYVTITSISLSSAFLTTFVRLAVGALLYGILSLYFINKQVNLKSLNILKRK